MTSRLDLGLFQDLVDPRLPTLSRCLEFGNDIGIEAQRNLLARLLIGRWPLATLNARLKFGKSFGKRSGIRDIFGGPCASPAGSLSARRAAY